MSTLLLLDNYFIYYQLVKDFKMMMIIINIMIIMIIIIIIITIITINILKQFFLSLNSRNKTPQQKNKTKKKLKFL